MIARVLLALFAFAIFGPLLNLVLWAFAERWYFPSKLPLEFGLTYWYRVFQPRGNALASLGTSVWIALLTVCFSLAVAMPAGYALARLKLPWRGAILSAFLLPQAVPNLPVYVNIAQVFYQIGLNGTVLGVVLVHASHGLVLAVWIASAAFASVDASLEEAARNLGASAWTCFRTVTLPLAAPGADRQRDLRVPRIARRVHRHLLRRRARRHDAAAADVQREHGRQLPDRVDHRAAAADPFDRLHAGRRALPEGRRAGDGGTLTRDRRSLACARATRICFRSATRASKASSRASGGTRRIDDGWTVTSTGMPNGLSRNCPLVGEHLHLGPSTARTAVRAEAYDQFRLDEADLAQQPVVAGGDFLLRRRLVQTRLPRISQLKCLTALVT